MCARQLSVALVAALLLLPACGGGNHKTVVMDEQECARGWNASDNAGSRAAVSRLLARGYSIHAGILLAESDALAAVNPVGCHIVVHDSRHSIAYYAKRDYVTDRFAFVWHDRHVDGPLVLRGAWDTNHVASFDIPNAGRDRAVREGAAHRPRMELYVPANATLLTDGTLTPIDHY